VMTDWGAAKSMVAGIKAGLELKMPGGSPDDIPEIVEAVQAGQLTVAELDEAVERILRVIDFVTSNKRDGVPFDREADHAVARDVAAECAVLLKNEGNLLPLDKKAKVAFVGAFAEAPRYQGSGSSFINAHRVESAVEAAKQLPTVTYAKGYDPAKDDADAAPQAQAVEAARNADVAVVFAGLPNHYESEGFDRQHLDLPAGQNALIEAVCAAQPNTVVVLHNGSAVRMPWAGRVPAILEMYLGGEAVGGAAVRLLFGEAVPSGKLAETFPHKLSDTPAYLNFPGHDARVEYREGVYVGYRYYDTKQMDVLFPFGHGLSYTRFAYRNLRLNKTDMLDTGTVQATLEVRNVGEVAGKEVVQLYVAPLTGEVPRPVRELKGFAKVALQPGETKQLTFTLGRRAFAYYNVKLHDWHVETARYAIEVGASSRDIRLTAELSVQSTVEVPVSFTQYATIDQILKSAKGQAVLGPVLQQMEVQARERLGGTENALSESNVDILRVFIMQAPLKALVEFGTMQKDQLQQLLAALNG